jgi:hypothetical protein
MQARMAGDRVVTWIHRVDGHLDAADDVRPQEGAHRALARRRPDDGDRPRQQDASDGPRIGPLLTTLDAVEDFVGRGQIPVEIDDPRLESPLQRPAGFGEHREHRSVVGEHFSGEVVDAVGAGDRREVFQQQRCDAQSLVLVVDHERGLGLVAPRPAFIARPADELVAQLDCEGDAVDHVDRREMCEVVFAEGRLRREEPAVDARRRLPLVECRQRLPIVGREWADERRVAVAEHDR